MNKIIRSAVTGALAALALTLTACGTADPAPADTVRTVTVTPAAAKAKPVRPALGEDDLGPVDCYTTGNRKCSKGTHAVCKTLKGLTRSGCAVRIDNECAGLHLETFNRCASLAVRAPYTSPDGRNHHAVGYMLVRECRTQYQGRELNDCLLHNYS